MIKLILAFALTLSFGNIYADSFSIMTMNVQNLFDAKDDYKKDDKAYLPLSMKQNEAHQSSCKKIRVKTWRNECLYLDWSDEAKDAKLKNIFNTIISYEEAGPDIIFFQEIENLNILRQLFVLLESYGYKYYQLLEGNDYRGIDNAVISKYEIKESKLHYIKFTGKNSKKDTRPILDILINIQNTDVRFYGVHFPAPYLDYEMRDQAFITLNELLINNKEPSIALGDFNVTSVEETKENMFNKHSNLWEIAHFIGCIDCKGTYYYAPDNNWSFLDTILASKNRNISLIPESIQLLKTPINIDDDNKPLRFSTKNFKGVSDHIPLVAKVKLSKKDLVD